MRLYFGFGANCHPDMIRAITGHGALSFPATITGFALCIESFQHIAKAAQHILRNHWDESFVSYGIACKPGASVCGRIWLLTNAQREAVKNWEIIGIWSHECTVKATMRIFGAPITITAESEELYGKHVKIVPGENYEPFIVPKEKVLAVATLVRQQRRTEY
ncbi:MAG: hypothetical protein AAB473_03810 [Patescibacteria group bacterium]